MLKFLTLFLILVSADISSIVICKINNINKNIIENQNIRWFFIHFISNCFVTYNGISDLKKCLKNPYEIDKFGWDENSWNTMNMAMLTHFYHCLFFRLTKADIIHHLTMVGIAGSIEYYQQSIICPAVLFFLSGFPGSIDFFLLYLVKLDLFSKEREKEIYLYITTYIRSPGACILSFISFYNFYIKNNFNIFYILSNILVFWNGQYYLMKHSLDYGKYLEIRRAEKLLWIEKNSPKYERLNISPKKEKHAIFS